VGNVVSITRGRMGADEVRAMSDAHGFYSAHQAARIARVPLQRLHAWRREGIIVPDIEVTTEGGTREVGYSFEALVYLRLLRMLREHDVPLVKAVTALKHLQERFGSDVSRWGQARIFMHGTEIIVHRQDEWQDTAASRRGQKVAAELFGEEFARLRERADALLIPRRFLNVVEIDPEARSGQPIVRDTTLPTALLHRLHQQGFKLNQIREAYPHLTASQIRGALAYERFLDEVA
jgi:uncharacterized protein (DUF433 family)